MDYLGAQGYWVCTLVAGLSFVLMVAMGQPIAGTIVAAAVVFSMYFVDTLIEPGVFRVLIAALLFSNLRATWMAARWKPDSEEAILPPRLSETFADKLADQFPTWLWPKVRIVYYVFSAGFLLLVLFGLAVMQVRGPK